MGDRVHLPFGEIVKVVNDTASVLRKIPNKETMKHNIFEGGNYQAQFALLIYKRLMSREWISNADIMADFLSCGSADKLPANVTNCEGYGELKKAFGKIRKLLSAEAGECVSERGNLKNKEFCYIGEKHDPLADMVAAAAAAKYKKDLSDYYQFCQDSAGFFPSSWVEHFFDKTLDLFEIDRKKKQGKELIGSSVTRKHKNIEWLPFIYECIRDKKVLHVSYREKFQVQSTVTFHPHFLKEFNGRWHIFGGVERYIDGMLVYKEGQNIPLDRIDKKPEILDDGTQYRTQDKIHYPRFFDDIVGTTHLKGASLYDEIVIRIHDEYMFGLITTKPIHHSQNTTMEFDKTKEYGEVTMSLRPNNEFYGRVLQMGSDLEIVCPQEVREEIARRIVNMNNRYK